MNSSIGPPFAISKVQLEDHPAGFLKSYTKVSATVVERTPQCSLFVAAVHEDHRRGMFGELIEVFECQRLLACFESTQLKIQSQFVKDIVKVGGSQKRAGLVPFAAEMMMDAEPPAKGKHRW